VSPESSLGASSDGELTYLLPREAAAIPRWSLRTFYRRAAEDPSLPCLRTGGSIRVPRERYLAWLRAQERGPRPPAAESREGWAGGVTRMPFGKYRGRELGELPDDYVEWLSRLDNLREPLKSAIKTEWSTRIGAWPGTLVRLPPAAVPIADELVTAGYRALTRRHHPDAGGDHGTMVLINTVAEWLRGAVRGAA
jgi:Putative quorum-sensing-regulated virulence factor